MLVEHPRLTRQVSTANVMPAQKAQVGAKVLPTNEGCLADQQSARHRPNYQFMPSVSAIQLRTGEILVIETPQENQLRLESVRPVSPPDNLDHKIRKQCL